MKKKMLNSQPSISLLSLFSVVLTPHLSVFPHPYKSFVLLFRDNISIDVLENDETTSTRINTDQAMILVTAEPSSVVTKNRSLASGHPYQRDCFQSASFTRQFTSLAVGPVGVGSISKPRYVREVVRIPPPYEQTPSPPSVETGTPRPPCRQLRSPTRGNSSRA